MATPKVKGIETEWSVVVRDRDCYRPANTTEFYLMINAIRKFFSLPFISGKDSLNEIENIERISDGKDLILEADKDPLWLNYASGSIPPGQPENFEPVETVKKRRKIPFIHHSLLPNGGRFYIDGPHIEYSTPECLSAKTLAAADRAGEAILNLAKMSINEILARQGLKMTIYKDTSERKGNSWGCHENYLVSRGAFDKIANPSLSLEAGYLISYFVVRQIFAGAGKMGIEGDGVSGEGSLYQISQRADFIKEILSHCTIERRAIINLRDEPHADRERFARLHVIVGDANFEFTTYLKVGITSIILKMIEDGFFDGDIILKDPVRAIKLVSQDLTCKNPILETQGGRNLSSLDMNREFFERARRYFSQVCEPSLEEQDLLLKWEEIISDFFLGNEERLRRRVDWKIKQNIFDNFLEAHHCNWKDLNNALIQDGLNSYKATDQLLKKDLLFHNINKEEGLYLAHKEAGDVEEILTKEEVIFLIKNPPEECRSYFRGKCVGKFYPQIDIVDWESIIFSGKKRKDYKNFGIFSPALEIELGNPLWGSKKDVGEILDNVDSVEDLLAKLKKIEK